MVVRLSCLTELQSQGSIWQTAFEPRSDIVELQRGLWGDVLNFL
jgi:hypothetical protein